MRRSAPPPDDTAALYTVRQVATVLDVQPESVRPLDSEGCGARPHERRAAPPQPSEVDHIAALVQLKSEGVRRAGAKRIIEIAACAGNTTAASTERAG